MLEHRMSLKEAYRYQKFLENNIFALTCYLHGNNAIKITETHQKSKVNPDAQDETIDATPERQCDCSIIEIANLANELIQQKLQLSMAIENAKKGLYIDWKEDGKNLTVDSAIEYAKKTRELAERLKYLLNLKTNTTKKVGTDYKFNQEGNQTQYKYNIDVLTEIDFDRNVINTLYKKLLNKADTLSTQIEETMLQEAVEYIPVYSLHDSTDEIVEAYLQKIKKKSE